MTTPSKPDILAFDLTRPPAEFIADPFPFYAALRRHAPVKQLGENSWLLTRHADLERVYKDIVALRDDACCVGSHLMGFYVGEVESDFGRRIYIIAAALHALAFLLVVSSIISDRARRPD